MRTFLTGRAGLGWVLLLMVGGGLACAWGWATATQGPPDLEREAFRILPWSAVERAADADDAWRIPLGRPRWGVDVRVLSTSCGCAHAAVEASQTAPRLVVRLAADRRPERVVVRVAIVGPDGAATLRQLALVPVRPVPPRACIALPVEVAAADAAVGIAHARTTLRAVVPPRLEGEPRLGLIARPCPDGYHVEVLGHGSPAFEAARLDVDGVHIPLRSFRRIR